MTAGLFVVAWFAAALTLSASGWFAQFSALTLFGAGTFISATAFLVLHRFHSGFRAMARSSDLKHVTEGQLFRLFGVLAFVKAREHVLPVAFAIPTGLIDVAVALSAPLVARCWLGTNARPRAAFFVWHVAGLAGLLTSVVLVLLTASPESALVNGGPTIQSIAMFPMSLVPTFVGPMVTALHLLAIVEARERTPKNPK